MNLTEKFYAKEELTKKERDIIGVGEWRLNRIKCKKCNSIITSDHRHDFKSCKCGAACVDGGSWYLKRCGNLEDIEDLSERYKDV